MMRKVSLVAALIAAIPTAVFAQGRHEVQGFGGVTIGTSAFGSAASPTFGGRFTSALTDNIEVVGEAGRLADLQSPVFDLLDFSNFGVHVNAWYGEGGVRFIASPHSAVRPYAEASAGFAHLNASVSGLPGTVGGLVEVGLNLINSTRPLLGVGAGTQFGAGSVVFDVGYRYKQISTGDTITSAFNNGNAFHVNQFRAALGIRF
jgi:opacity protein-like surface antigen